MPPKEKRMKLGDLATWAGIGCLIIGGAISYGELKGEVKSLHQDVSDIKLALRERGIIASTETNTNAFGN